MLGIVLLSFFVAAGGVDLTASGEGVFRAEDPTLQ